MFHMKDPGSAITHFIGFVAAIFSTPGLLVYAASRHVNQTGMISMSVFMMSMILLYGASTAYHTFIVGTRTEMILKRIDHMMIFALIAGSYTPICAMVLAQPVGSILLIVIWSLALLGMMLKLVWVTCPKWFSSVVYIAMGWACVFVIPQLYASVSFLTFILLAAGGVIYTVGGVIYALKLRVFNQRFPKFGSHEVFHVCVMIGSLCHYLAIASILPR
ncbi:MAG: hemolysin III family protein [Eubacteriales bacterium]|nr:hemolysin III family protein [Eubacteriales bacterium]